MAAHRQAVLLFNEGSLATYNAETRGGKGAGLADMVALGLPVPPGFTIATGVSRAYAQHGTLPRRITGQLQRSLVTLEHETGKRFGDPSNPLLVSVRSGARDSMPGMMDTVLNVGMNPEVFVGLIDSHGQAFARDLFSRFLKQFGELVLGSKISIDGASANVDLLEELWSQLGIPSDAHEQLQLAIEAVLRSWSSPRAITYRAEQGLPEWLGTAVTVQAMVFGNRDDASGTGVVFSSDPATGQAGLMGEYLPNAQGEELVSGTRTPFPLSYLEHTMPTVYTRLEQTVDALTTYTGAIVDVEFTIESGRLYILQCRKAMQTAQAAATFAVQRVWAKQWSHHEAVKSLNREAVLSLNRAAFSAETLEAAQGCLLATGLPASPGSVVGRIAHTEADVDALKAQGQKVVLMRLATSPEDLPLMLKSDAIITMSGGSTCHAAVVARGLGLPAVVGAQVLAMIDVPVGTIVSVDGASGSIFRGELPLEEPVQTKEVNIFLRWTERFAVIEPRLRFELQTQSFCANQMLNDFYLINSMVHAAGGSPLARELQAAQREVVEQIATAFATYLAIAVAGEIRYSDELDFVRQQPLKVYLPIKTLRARFGVSFSSLREDGQDQVLQTLTGLERDGQLRFVRLCQQVFTEGEWRVGIGGRRWGQIAQALGDFLEGVVPAEVFVDHAFDLQHNGRRLFNKHSMFRRCTDEDVLKHQLDIKRDIGDVKQLRERLLSVSQPLPFTVSPEVDELYHRGQELKLW